MQRIVIDMDLCQGHGVCESEAPELFEVGRDRKVRIAGAVAADAAADGHGQGAAHLSDAQQKALNMAVKYCPTHALSVVDVATTETTVIPATAAMADTDRTEHNRNNDEDNNDEDNNDETGGSA